jgi:hypothetical protein
MSQTTFFQSILLAEQTLLNLSQFSTLAASQFQTIFEIRA